MRWRAARAEDRADVNGPEAEKTKGRKDGMRVGTGYDVHRFAEGRKLVLGGVEIEYERGLDGHSDADVALHAVMDALLGAAALGDIGRHFPDTDPAYEGISSLELLKKVADLLEEKLYYVENVDCTIVAQEPKLACRSLESFLSNRREKRARWNALHDRDAWRKPSGFYHRYAFSF